jgi:uncharacterized membrane protein
VSADGLLSGPLGPPLVIAAMAIATYLCRIGGVVIMSYVRLTPTVERALAALPGSIVAATVVPLALKSGPAAIGGVLASVLVMHLTHREFAAIAAGMAVGAGVRALGLP